MGGGPPGSRPRTDTESGTPYAARSTGPGAAAAPVPNQPTPGALLVLLPPDLEHYGITSATGGGLAAMRRSKSTDDRPPRKQCSKCAASLRQMRMGRGGPLCHTAIIWHPRRHLRPKPPTTTARTTSKFEPVPLRGFCGWRIALGSVGRLRSPRPARKKWNQFSIFDNHLFRWNTRLFACCLHTIMRGKGDRGAS